MLDVSTVNMNTGGEAFKCLVLSVPKSKKTVIFAAGRGGDPSRYMPLLEGLAQQNYSVVAPTFPKLATAFPSEKELKDRARRIVTARMNMVSLRQFDRVIQASTRTNMYLKGIYLQNIFLNFCWKNQKERLV